jgi:V8-like Glu-specific endopeptidase
MWKTDCPSLGGASGSPIWTASNEVIALSRGSLAKTETINSVDPQGTDSNIAIPISTMFTPAELQRIKDKYGCDNKTSL